MMKNTIRQILLEKRNALETAELLEKSDKIKQNLFSITEYIKSKSVMFFVSFDNEVHTHDIINEALKNKIVIVPKVINHQIEPALIADFNNLIPSGKFDILEPIEPISFNRKKIDIVIVAGIAFDRRGYRIGYGFGYYDRFLKTVPRSKKIGLAFDFQIVDNIPEQSYDIPVEVIVTDKEVIKC